MPWAKTGTLPVGGGSGTDVHKAADQAVGTAQTVVLSYALPGAGTYAIAACLLVVAGSTAVGIRPNLTATGTAPTALGYTTETPGSATAEVISYNQAGAAAAAIAGASFVQVKGTVVVGGAGTTINVTMAAETGAGVTVKAGSYINVRKVA